MLRELRIHNLAVVEDVTLSFEDGLNVLTGSTGAGKSLILSAVNILLGGRSNPRAIRAGKDKLVVEGLFALGSPVEGLVVPLSDGGRVLRLRREIHGSGRSQAYLNDKACTLKQLVEIASELIEPHGQNEQLQLRDAENHVTYVDKYASNAELMEDYSSKLAAFKGAAETLTRFDTKMNVLKEKQELLQYRVEELDRAAIKADEKMKLEDDVRVFENSQKIFDVLSEAQSMIYDAEPSAVELVASAAKQLARIEALDKRLSDLARQLETAQIQLSESASEMRGYLERLEFDPQMLSDMQERLSVLLDLERRYGMSIEELLSSKAKWQRELESIAFEDEERKKLHEEKERALEHLREAAVRLSRSRKRAARELDKRMSHEMEQLMIKGARFRTDFAYTAGADGELRIDDTPVHAQAWGIDRVVFYVQTNPGETEGNVAEVASSGELSRIALALKSVVGMGRVGSVLVFDELDSGVGADMGGLIAERLQGLSARYQIICITHLPQIAAKASNHLVVRKTSQKGRTFTHVDSIQPRERVQEIARMLGGKEGSEKRLALAEEMLQLKKGKISSDVRP